MSTIWVKYDHIRLDLIQLITRLNHNYGKNDDELCPIRLCRITLEHDIFTFVWRVTILFGLQLGVKNGVWLPLNVGVVVVCEIRERLVKFSFSLDLWTDHSDASVFCTRPGVHLHGRFILLFLVMIQTSSSF